MRNRIITLTLIVALSCSAFGFKACTKSERDRNVAFAQDVVSAFNAASAYIPALGRDLQTEYKDLIDLAGKLLEAVKASDAATMRGLLRDLLPLYNDIAAALTNNKTALAILAIGDIGLHFLVNHLPPDPATAASPVKAGKGDARALGVIKQDAIEDFRRQTAWGCDYQPIKCDALQ